MIGFRTLKGDNGRSRKGLCRIGREGEAYLLAGVEYLQGGKIKAGLCNRRWGVVFGVSWYPDEKEMLQFIGLFYDKRRRYGGYYGPQYPDWGLLFSQEGKPVRFGRMKVHHKGSLGYPYIVFPDGSEIPAL